MVETWRATYNSKFGQHSICTNERVAYGETSKIAQILTSLDPFEDLAKAVLMAAAPEMREVLRVLVEGAYMVDSGGCPSPIHEAAVELLKRTERL